MHDALRALRAAKGISQLALSLRLGVSQRHVSYVENGRTQPSRTLLAHWLDALDVSLPTRNALAQQAGYAPLFSHAALSDPDLALARHALSQLVTAHDPLPCYVIDANWNLLQTNAGGLWLSQDLMPWLSGTPPNGPLNMLDLFSHPEGIATRVVNLAVVGPQMLRHLRHEAITYPAIAPRVQQVALRLNALLGVDVRSGGLGHATTAAPPLMTTQFRTSLGVLSFFSMFTTFGTPHDITLSSIRVEHFFAADAQTSDRLRALG
ncbi:MAG: helix-turn-helix transcriptional regulator [Gemmatimonadaceae bacterium]|nr:helix-turn-helix transcriptional regulator [Gemmatimonadaceae bacterium]